MKKILTFFAVLLVMAGCSDSKKSATGSVSVPRDQKLRVLYWNIQDGMKSDQGNEYDNFVKWVKDQDPDVCIWCEAESKVGNYLPDNWGELAKRYGHDYHERGGMLEGDNNCQVITSKHKITPLLQSVGDENVTISRGMGCYSIQFNNRAVNFVSVHLWPYNDYFLKDETGSGTGGHYRRYDEISWICEKTVDKTQNDNMDLWVMAGDFNSQSSYDNNTYNYPTDTTAFLVHDYLRDNTILKDVIYIKHPTSFKTTTSVDSRIDYVFCSPAMLRNVIYADVVKQNWLGYGIIHENKEKHPSDHLPIMVEFYIKK